MTKKSTILLVTGVALFIASPFLFFLAPGWIAPLFYSSTDYYSYIGVASVIGVISLSLAVILGTALILIALRSKKRK